MQSTRNICTFEPLGNASFDKILKLTEQFYVTKHKLNKAEKTRLLTSILEAVNEHLVEKEHRLAEEGYLRDICCNALKAEHNMLEQLKEKLNYLSEIQKREDAVMDWLESQFIASETRCFDCQHYKNWHDVL